MSSSYVERSFWEERTFAFDDATVRYSGRERFGADVEQNVPLAELGPTPARIWVRSKNIDMIATWIVGISVLVLAAVPFMIGLARFDPEKWARWLYALFFVFLGGLVVTLMLAPKKEYATFHSHAGVPMLSIGRDSKNPQLFHEFVKDLSTAIERAARGTRESTTAASEERT